jgi:hypothetical protein
MHHPLRRVSALAAAALAVGSLSLSTAGAAQAAAAADPVPATVAATWLGAHLQNGLVPFAGGSYVNDGASADAILSLTTVGGQEALAHTIATALAGDIDNYVTASGGATVDPGAAGKAAVALRSAGLDPTSVGSDHENLISDIVSTMQPSGRVQVDGPYGDWANTLSQAFAVGALAGAGSSQAENVQSATTFLLSQQCDDGWFRLYFDATAPDGSGNTYGTDETCAEDPASTPSTDATATAILELVSQQSNSTVAADLAKAKAWLVATELPDGGWGDASVGGTSNVNSTALAGWALGALGDTPHAAAAARWVRAHQILNVGGCTTFAAGDRGILALDDAAFKGAATAPIGVTDAALVGTAQAMAVLKSAPAPSGPLTVTAPTGYVRAGSTQQVTVAGEAPGSALCLNGQSWNAAAGGSDTRSITASAGSATYTVTDVDGRTAAATIAALGPKKLKVKVKGAKTLHRGRKATVKVKGLAAGEHVKVTLRGKKVAGGTAKANGVFKAKIRLKGKKLNRLGKAKLKATGQFADIRKGNRTVKVVR